MLYMSLITSLGVEYLGQREWMTLRFLIDIAKPIYTLLNEY